MAPSQVAGSSAPRRFARIVLVQIGIGFGLLLLMELIARLAGFGARPMYVPHGDLLWTLIPNQRVRNHVTSRPVTIGADGMRIVPGAGDEPGRRQVLCLGNSVSYGYGVADSETYESLLQRAVEARDPGRWRFRNGAVMGYNLYYERLWLAELRARGFHPDAILLGFTFNDVPSWPGEHLTAPERERIRQSIRFKNAMRSIALYNVLVEKMMTPELYRFRRKYLPFGFGSGPKGASTAPSPAPAAPPSPSPRAEASPPPAPDSARGRELTPAETDWHADWFPFYRAELIAMLDAARAADAPVLAVVWPDPQQKETRYREIFMEVCRQRGVPYVDLQPVFLRHPGLPYFDPVHPDAPTFRTLVDEGILPLWLSQQDRMNSLRLEQGFPPVHRAG